jgi:hypothetical protein
MTVRHSAIPVCVRLGKNLDYCILSFLGYWPRVLLSAGRGARLACRSPWEPSRLKQSIVRFVLQPVLCQQQSHFLVVCRISVLRAVAPVSRSLFTWPACQRLSLSDLVGSPL